jgi:hypothetical protein
MRKRINESVQKWNHTLKTAGTKKLVDEKKGTVEFGKIFGYDNGKTVDTCKSHGGKQIY